MIKSLNVMNLKINERIESLKQLFNFFDVRINDEN